jgi:hypothetical protein
VPTLAHPDRPGRPPQLTPSTRGRTEEVTTTQPTHLTATEDRPRRRARGAFRRLPAALVLAAALLIIFATPAFAQGTGAPTLSGVIDNLRNWIVGILAGVATLFLTIGGLRYLTAAGDPGQVEKAKTALKSAAIGYALAILAPLLVSILASIVGG